MTSSVVIIKALITHLCDILRRKKGIYGIETLSIDRVLNKEDIYEKIMHQKLVPDPILNLKYNLKQPSIPEILLKIRHFERELSKGLEKVNLIFSFKLNPL